MKKRWLKNYREGKKRYKVDEIFRRTFKNWSELWEWERKSGRRETENDFEDTKKKFVGRWQKWRVVKYQKYMEYLLK